MPALRQYRIFISHAWAYNDHYHSLVGWFNNAANFWWFDHSVPEHDPLQVNSDTALRRKLDDQIKGCHAVVIMGGMYVNYRRWIQAEIDLALRYNKPIIVVRPWGSQVLPKVLQDVAHEIVAWQSANVIDAIRSHAL